MKGLPSISAAVVTVLVVGVALATAQGDDSNQPAVSAAARDRAAVEAVAPGLPELIGAFRREQTKAEASDGRDTTAALADLSDARPGENPSLMRRLELPGGRHANVWPMANGLCWSADTTGGCAPTALLRERGALVASSYSSAKPGMWLFVRARDGISEVTFVFDDRTTVARALQDNALIAEFQRSPIEVRWRNVDGTAGSQPTAAP